jgi:hypothetical protein
MLFLTLFFPIFHVFFEDGGDVDDGDGGEIQRDESKDEDDDLIDLIQLDDDLFSVVV